ncbi:MAG: heavy metal-responsive transcriptional regulator [Thiobacillus sp.]|uniref:heavy metal-responsive transcriptional regulator n=1 Tax=Thiobacillus sp. 0-1251 TaxID=1895858 RepID=UPI00086B30C6|nr:heavy metal-responsive transcriptional regulator [Thiobacillus sp. 0-1251]MBN8765298.1 heavy metal-responsive transcriptional regulator [Thiobacillus sp.]ODU30193.1 MAG: heavy metal-responsive transcriptional regulator [Thiobacillus sp. SCN 62-729]OJY54863.1 MAG: heavy metal-responsive transcriptional regulator [Thiobacillus sp. 0-1251]
MYTIGRIAAQVGISADTLRYYEKEGLLQPAKKSDAGYRLYDADAVRRLHFIKHAQHCGFSLAEIRELLTLKNSDAACCRDVRNVAIQKKLQLEHKLRALHAMSQALTELIAVCNDETRSLDDCPILAALETSLGRQQEAASDA